MTMPSFRPAASPLNSATRCRQAQHHTSTTAASSPGTASSSGAVPGAGSPLPAEQVCTGLGPEPPPPPLLQLPLLSSASMEKRQKW